MEVIEQAYYGLFTAAVLILALLIIFSIFRSVIGPRTADRIIAVNMVGTMIIMIIAILSVALDQNYLVDICLIYAMISFLGVVVLCKVYTGVYLQKKQQKATLDAVARNIREQKIADEKENSGGAVSAGTNEGRRLSSGRPSGKSPEKKGTKENDGLAVNGQEG